MPNLKPVQVTSGGYGVITTCKGCGTRLDGRRDTILADLDGEAFEAYYCTPCSLIELRAKHEVANG